VRITLKVKKHLWRHYIIEIYLPTVTIIHWYVQIRMEMHGWLQQQVLSLEWDFQLDVR